MDTYIPEEWVLLKIENSFYKVFASWSGGYLESPNWRLNSGITKCTEDEYYYYFHGESGSVYKCLKSQYGIRNSYNSHTLSSLCSIEGTTLLKEPNVMEIEW